MTEIHMTIPSDVFDDTTDMATPSAEQLAAMTPADRADALSTALWTRVVADRHAAGAQWLASVATEAERAAAAGDDDDLDALATDGAAYVALAVKRAADEQAEARRRVAAIIAAMDQAELEQAAATEQAEGRTKQAGMIEDAINAAQA